MVALSSATPCGRRLSPDSRRALRPASVTVACSRLIVAAGSRNGFARSTARAQPCLSDLALPLYRKGLGPPPPDRPWKWPRITLRMPHHSDDARPCKSIPRSARLFHGLRECLPSCAAHGVAMVLTLCASVPEMQKHSYDFNHVGRPHSPPYEIATSATSSPAARKRPKLACNVHGTKPNAQTSINAMTRLAGRRTILYRGRVRMPYERNLHGRTR